MHKIRLTDHALLLAFAGAIAAMLPLLGVRLLFELQAPQTADSSIYWAVGQGILNGLTPYRDLFETKPPGIFLVSSLSLWLTGGVLLGAVLQTIAIACIVPLMMLAVREQRHVRESRAFALLSAGLLGGILALYSAERSGAFQVESFGAAFACLALWGVERAKRTHDDLASVLMIAGAFGAVGMKEPFALSVLAGILLLSPSVGRAARHAVLAFGVTAFLGVALLGVLGYLEPYVGVYLREMFGNHVVSAGSPLDRMLRIELLARDLWSFSPAVTVALGMAWILGLSLTFLAAPSWGKRADVIVRNGLALLLISAAVGMGGAYYNHHFVFAVPGYAAACIVFLQNAERLKRHSVRTTARGMLAALCLFGSVSSTHLPYEAELAWQENEARMMKEAAAMIDDVLSSCGEERYLFVGGNGSQPYALTKHSPLGPVFFQYDYFLDGARPAFSDAFEDSVRRARIAVMQTAPEPYLSEHARALLHEEFTEEPPPCAAGKRLQSNHRLLFRKGFLR